MRSIKRERYAVKELQKLQEVLSTVNQQELQEIATVRKAHELVKPEPVGEHNTEETDEKTENADMEVDKTKKIYNRKLQDQHGNYPPWMSRRRIKKKKVMDKKRKNKDGF